MKNRKINIIILIFIVILFILFIYKNYYRIFPILKCNQQYYNDLNNDSDLKKGKLHTVKVMDLPANHEVTITCYPGLDTKSFDNLGNRGFAKDKNFVYTTKKMIGLDGVLYFKIQQKIKNIDPKNFTVYTYSRFYKGKRFPISVSGILLNNNKVYFYLKDKIDGNISLKLLDEFNIKYFNIMYKGNYNYAIDGYENYIQGKEGLYYVVIKTDSILTKKLEGINPKDFSSWNGSNEIFTDGKYLIYRGNIKKNIDLESLNDNDIYYIGYGPFFRDKNYIYNTNFEIIKGLQPKNTAIFMYKDVKYISDGKITYLINEINNGMNFYKTEMILVNINSEMKKEYLNTYALLNDPRQVWDVDRE